MRSTKYKSPSRSTMLTVSRATSSSAVFVIFRIIIGSTISQTVVRAAQNKSVTKIAA